MAYALVLSSVKCDQRCQLFFFFVKTASKTKTNVCEKKKRSRTRQFIKKAKNC